MQFGSVHSPVEEPRSGEESSPWSQTGVLYLLWSHFPRSALTLGRVGTLTLGKSSGYRSDGQIPLLCPVSCPVSCLVSCPVASMGGAGQTWPRLVRLRFWLGWGWHLSVSPTRSCPRPWPSILYSGSWLNWPLLVPSAIQLFAAMRLLLDPSSGRNVKGGARSPPGWGL